MARRFNGTSDFIVFTLPSTLQSVVAGSTTLVAVLNPADGTDGALVHARTSGGGNSWWMEFSGNVWNYGQGTTPKNIGGQTNGSWAAYIGRKVTGGANAPRGRKIVFGGATTDTTAGTGLADGTAPGAGGVLQVGKWGTASEFINADIAAVAVFTSDLSDATVATFTTWANILAASPAWAVAFNQANATDAITDATGGGGNSSSITGTTIVSDPAGFFGTTGASPSGLAVPVAFGSPTAVQAQTAAPGGIALAVALGSPTAALDRAVAPTGIAVSATLGIPASAIPAVAPAGLAVPVALGAPTVALGRSAAPGGIAASVAVGTPSVSSAPGPVGIALAVALGVPTVALGRTAAPTGIAVPAALGQPGSVLALTAGPSGIAVPVAVGSPGGGVDPVPGVLIASGISTTLTAAGAPASTLTAGGTAATLTASGTP